MALTDKQQRFVDEYLIDLNASQAAIRAGYSPKTANRIGPQCLSKLVIQSAIQGAMAERGKRTEITQDRVLEELALIGFADMKDFIKIDDGGAIQAYPLDSLGEGKSRIIRKVKEKRTIKSTPEGDQILESTYEFELCDKVKSLEMIGRHLGMFADKPDPGADNPEDAARKMREAAQEMRKVTNAVAPTMDTI